MARYVAQVRLSSPYGGRVPLLTTAPMEAVDALVAAQQVFEALLRGVGAPSKNPPEVVVLQVGRAGADPLVQVTQDPEGVYWEADRPDRWLTLTARPEELFLAQKLLAERIRASQQHVLDLLTLAGVEVPTETSKEPA